MVCGQYRRSIIELVAFFHDRQCFRVEIHFGFIAIFVVTVNFVAVAGDFKGFHFVAHFSDFRFGVGFGHPFVFRIGRATVFILGQWRSRRCSSGCRRWSCSRCRCWFAFSFFAATACS